MKVAGRGEGYGMNFSKYHFLGTTRSSEGLVYKYYHSITYDL